MTYHIEPKTESELDMFGLVDEGVYDFEVYKSEGKTSASGNDMVKLHLKVWTHDGSLKLIYDYLVFSPAAFCVRKIKHFCDSVGISHEYEAGEIREDFSGLNGKVELKIKTGEEIPSDRLNGKPLGSKYPTKNEVKDYIMTAKDAVKHDGMKPLPEKKNEFNDDIPW